MARDRPSAGAEELAPSKSLASRFTDVHPKPFEASIGRLASKRDCGHQTLAANLGRSPSSISRLKDPGDQTHLRASEVALACQGVNSVSSVDEIFEGVRIDGSEWHMQRKPESIATEDVQVASMELVAQAGGYMRALVRRLPQGLDRRERAELRAELRELRQQLDALDAGLA